MSNLSALNGVPNMDQNQFERLPKWAQRQINILEMRLREARARLAVGAEDSNSFAAPYSDPPLPLGRDAHVQWMLGASEYLDARLIDGRLRVSAAGNVRVLPHAANVVVIELG